MFSGAHVLPEFNPNAKTAQRPPFSEFVLTQQQKKELRGKMRTKRKNLPVAEREQRNLRLNQHLQQRLSELQPCLVSAFLAFDGEPDLAPSFKPLIKAGFQFVLPVIEKHDDNQDSHATMIFRSWQPNDVLAANPFGISEPGSGQPVSVEEIGVMLLPLVAWDEAGGRLGMGAGYYDRALAPFRSRKSPLRIGVAYQLQRTDHVPMDTHDVRLHELITDKQRFTFLS